MSLVVLLGGSWPALFSSSATTSAGKASQDLCSPHAQEKGPLWTGRNTLAAALLSSHTGAGLGVAAGGWLPARAAGARPPGEHRGSCRLQEGRLRGTSRVRGGVIPVVLTRRLDVDTRSPRAVKPVPANRSVNAVLLQRALPLAVSPRAAAFAAPVLALRPAIHPTWLRQQRGAEPPGGDGSCLGLKYVGL